MKEVSRTQLRTQLKKELAERFEITSVAEITKARLQLNHEEPDSTDITEVEANAVRQWFEQNGQPLQTASGKKRTRKVRTDDEANKDAIVASAKSRHSSLLSAGAKTGVSEADDFQLHRQTAFLQRLEQHNKRDAELIEKQLLSLSGHVSETTETPNISALEESEIYLEGEETNALPPSEEAPPSAGIGFSF